MKDVTKVKIQILGQEFTLHIGKAEKAEPKPHWAGACHSTQRDMCVLVDDEDDPVHTLFHEVFHAHLRVSGASVQYDDKEEEDLCDLFAAVMTQYVHQNPNVWSGTVRLVREYGGQAVGTAVSNGKT